MTSGRHQINDYYGILGVARNATPTDIKRAYRKLAREIHPDVNPSRDATAKFKELSEAYRVLSDSRSRERHDLETGLLNAPQTGTSSPVGASFGDSFYFSSASGSPTRSRRVPVSGVIPDSIDALRTAIRDIAVKLRALDPDLGNAIQNSDSSFFGVSRLRNAIIRRAMYTGALPESFRLFERVVDGASSEYAAALDAIQHEVLAQSAEVGELSVPLFGFRRTFTARHRAFADESFADLCEDVGLTASRTTGPSASCGGTVYTSGFSGLT